MSEPAPDYRQQTRPGSALERLGPLASSSFPTSEDTEAHSHRRARVHSLKTRFLAGEGYDVPALLVAESMLARTATPLPRGLLAGLPPRRDHFELWDETI